MYALILDAELKSALAAGRELAALGVEVVMASDYTGAIGFSSRCKKDSFVYTSPKQSQQLFIADLKNYLQTRVEKPVLMTFSDATYLTVATFAEELAPHAQLKLPNIASRDWVFNKQATYDLARSHKIPTIKEYSLEEEIVFPVVAKPRTSVSWKSGTGVFGTAEVVFSRPELERTVQKILATTGQTPIIQAMVVGEEYGVELLCDEGKILTSFVHKRIRSLSPRGGASTVKEELANGSQKEHMMQRAKTLAEAVNWTGPLMVEFKKDEDLDEIVLMEMNGRFWGSLPLPLAAGVPFVQKYYELVTGQQLPEVKRTSIARTQHLLGDIRWLLLVWFKRDSLRKQLYPKRLSATADFFRDTVMTRKDVWSPVDPLPFFKEMVQSIMKK